VLSAANYVTPIPDGITDADAAPQLCAGVTVYSALRKSGAQSGDTIAILGAGGGLGHIAVQLASRGFALRVIGVDADAKEQLVLDSGAEKFIGLGSREKPTDTVQAVKDATAGAGVQAVVVLTAANAAYATAVPMLKFGGRVLCVGIPEGALTAIASAYPQLIIGKELSIQGVAVGNRKEAIETLDFAARGLIKVHSKIEKLENLTSIFEDMNAGKLQGRVVVDLS
jgi:propanol-preferring alcohol dehydrogenase